MDAMEIEREISIEEAEKTNRKLTDMKKNMDALDDMLTEMLTLVDGENEKSEKAVCTTLSPQADDSSQKSSSPNQFSISDDSTDRSSNPRRSATQLILHSAHSANLSDGHSAEVNSNSQEKCDKCKGTHLRKKGEKFDCNFCSKKLSDLEKHHMAKHANKMMCFCYLK